MRLGDVVRMTLRVGGGDTNIEAELPVGRPPSETGPNAIRTAEINFVTLSGVNSAPQTIVNRMSEDWAQAAVRFDLVSQSTITPVENVLTVEGSPTGNGTLSVDVNGQPVMVNVDGAISAGAIAYLVASAIEDSTGLNSSPFADGGGNRWLVIVDRGQNVTFANWSDTFANLDFNPPMLSYNNPINQTEANILGLNFKDGNDQTIDLFAVTVLPGDTLGFSGFDDSQVALPGMVNTIIIEEQAVDSFDDYPMVAGHEAGHVLLNEPGHSTGSVNLMYPTTGQKETYDATKRLTSDQQGEVRSDSGPGSNGPVLLQPKPLPNQQRLNTNDARYAKTQETPENE